MKIIKGFLIFLLFGVVIVGCGNGVTATQSVENSPLPSLNPPTELIELPTPTQLLTQSPTPEPTPGNKQAKEMQPNEFNQKDIKVGDIIVGLKVAAIERDTIVPDSIIIHFDGQLELKGSFDYYTREELGQENYLVYLTLDQTSFVNYPRIKSDNMDYPERIGIANSEKFEKLFGPAGSKGSMVGTFSHYILVSAPFKPAEGSIELDKATVRKNN